MENKNKKLRRVRFNPKDGIKITACSLVDKPAIEQDFKFFSAIPKDKQLFKITDEERMEITGPIMRANFDILRYDKEKNEYYNCYFLKEDLTEFRNQYLKNNFHQSANFQHGNYFTEDICGVEFWQVIDVNMDTAIAKGFKDLEEGDIYMTYKVYNKELWEEIKKSELKGFSVELSFEDFDEISDEEKDIQDIMDDLFLKNSDKKKAIIEITEFHTVMENFTEVGELSFADYPTSAVDCALKALQWKLENPESTCGTKLMWTRANQIANKKPLSYSTLKRIALGSKLESKANASKYGEGCMSVAWDAFGGTDLIYWCMAKLSQIDALISGQIELEKQNKKNNPYGF